MTHPEIEQAIARRERIAAQILAGMLAAQAHPQSDGVMPIDTATADAMAGWALIYADALIRKLSTPGSEGGVDGQ